MKAPETIHALPFIASILRATRGFYQSRIIEPEVAEKDKRDINVIKCTDWEAVVSATENLRDMRNR